jgi:GT2 family glycosyltransferase
MSIRVSVVIPTFRRPQLLKRCIDALLMQTLHPSEFEIIIVDDDGSDETRELVARSARSSQPAIRYLRNGGKHGPAAARNEGWKNAKGPLIAFTDDDCIPERDWLARGMAAFNDDTAGVCGRIIVPVSRTPTDYELNTSFLEFAEFATANCFYTRTALESAGGFDERFTKAWREDADLFFTLLKRGEPMLFVRDAVVVHPVRTGGWGISLREQSKSMFNALLYKKHPVLYKKKIGNSVLPLYYTIVSSSFLFLLGIVFGFHTAALGAFSVWMAATGFLSLKRLKGTSHSLSHVLEMILTSLLNPFLSVSWRLVGAVKFRVFFY